MNEQYIDVYSSIYIIDTLIDRMIDWFVLSIALFVENENDKYRNE